jgi:hypothetical protein
MAVTANLKIQLMADSVLVAESEDALLWQRVFSAIQKGQGSPGAPQGADLDDEAERDDSGEQTDQPGANVVKGAASFAKELGVSPDVLVGACAPSIQSPYIHMDDHHWEALKKNTPGRGPTAIPPAVMAATLLGLWFKHAGLAGGPTVLQCQAVLQTIDLRDRNAARALRHCSWLQNRKGSVLVNPAERSRALRLAKAYCLKKVPEESAEE